MAESPWPSSLQALTTAPAARRRRRRPRRRPRWRDYVTLTKPRIMSLLVLTSVCAMVAAAGGAPAPLALVALVVGGALACGGASALNHVLDRDIDRLMGPRTASRPVAAGRISPARAAAFGLALSALSFVILTAFDNLLAAALALSGGAFYVLVYTLGSSARRRRTSSSAAPPARSRRWRAGRRRTAGSASAPASCS